MAHELFSRIADILSAPSETQALIMHETLVIACHEGLKKHPTWFRQPFFAGGVALPTA